MPSQQQLNAFTQAFHREAIARLAEKPELVARALKTLDRWHVQRGPGASDPYFRQWRAMLEGDLQVMRQRVCADGEEAATLRNVSPLGFVLTPAERQLLRRQSAS
jgi:ribosomal protein L16 Arg81 hydroxylase